MHLRSFILISGRILILIMLLGEVQSISASPEGDLIVLENDAVRVGIDPAVGRVMAFTPKVLASRNFLWVNSVEDREREASQAGYENWGGDKVWPVAQPFWRYAMERIWPPDTTVDGSSAEAECVGGRLLLRFGVSEHFHSQLEREFELDASRPVLRIRNRITQLRHSPFPAQIWSITQVPLPGRIMMEVAAEAPTAIEQPVNLNGIRSSPPLGPKPFTDGAVVSGDRWVAVRPDADVQLKLGTLGGWIAGVWPDGILVQQVAYDEEGMYPEGTSLQFYHDDRYGELETLGPAKFLNAGETLETCVTWLWLPPLETGIDDADFAERLAEHITHGSSLLWRGK